MRKRGEQKPQVLTDNTDFLHMGMTINGVSASASLITNQTNNVKSSRGQEIDPAQKKDIVNGVQSSRTDVVNFIHNSKSRSPSYRAEKSVDASFEGEEGNEKTTEKKEKGKGEKGNINIKA